MNFAKIVSKLQRCSYFKDLESIYASMIKTSAHEDCFLVNQFIGVCLSFRRTDYGALAFSEMENPNVFVYNAMIRSYSQCGTASVQALEVYLQMLRAGVAPTSFTFCSLIKACTVAMAMRYGEMVHGQIWKNGFASHLFVETSLIDFYSSLHRVVECQRVFDEMLERDVFAWTTMVSVYVRNGDMGSARRLFEEMPQRNTASWNTLISGYARIGDVKSSATLFNRMPAKDLITWTTMITCYAQNKQFMEAIEVFEEMKNIGISPDEVTMATVISACAHLGALELGRDVHCYVMNNGFNLDVYIGSALIDMYSKCGSLERSLVIFFKLRKKNLFCWNSIIEGLAVHGYGEAALEMFKKMELEKIKPNGVTFVSVLSACTHAGLVEEARTRFLSMTRDYSITPGIEHYGCMVNLLGRAGVFEEALDLIKDMKVEPNSVIWGALLGGCKLHGNLDIAQTAVDKLMFLEPDNNGYYALLVNMYAEANRWGEVARLRGIMKERGVQKKCPGLSWIEMDGRVQEFVASDKSHPMANEICELLAQLDGQLRLANHVPELSKEW